MEKEWCRADASEETSRGGSQGRASMEMFFSSFRAYAKAAATETENRLARLETASKISFVSVALCNFSIILAFDDKRTALYNRLVASYHKAKIERAEMARELEDAKAVAARVPQLEEDLQVARAQRPEAEKAAKAVADKAQETDGELTRLRRLEANHVIELESVKRVEQEKVDNLSKRLEEVDQQRLKLRQEVTSKSNELSATAKRWVGEISSLDRGLAAAFPEVQAVALAAAGKAREARRQATGEQSFDCFSMDDYLASMAARVEPITMLGWELRKAAEELTKAALANGDVD
ncbi:hypothetical protein QYE76_018726 [Lolium multiflorum]|uniref:Uncharacterized protein n=1 Tax=Lolium multiflorum TaxID=4521 RepID=A0AAD8QDA4_LOLMU|nr:hypothetical protein QYE76_018726 [Lolium multiflorum]